MVVLKMPDGVDVDFGYMAKDQIHSLVKSKFPEFDKPVEQNQNNNIIDTLEDTAHGIYQGLTNGYIDEIAGGINGVVYGVGDKITGRGDGTFHGGFQRGYNQKRDEYRQEYSHAQERSPIATSAGEIAGAVSNPITSKLGAGLVGKTTPLTKKIATGAAVGLVDGASYGAGKSIEQKWDGIGKDALEGGAWGTIGGAAMPAAFHGLERGLNAYKVKSARSTVKEMLENRKDFDKIDFGILRKEKVDALNKIRQENGVDLLSKRRLKIPANVVKHLQERRMITDGMKADDVADMLISAFHSPQGVVDRSKYPHIQAMINPKEKISDIGFVGVNPTDGEIVVKSAYKMLNERASKEYANIKPLLDGRTEPSSFRGKPPVAAARFSDLQQGFNADNLAEKYPNVKLSKLTNESLTDNPNLTMAQKKAVKGSAEYEVLHNVDLQNQSLKKLADDFDGVKDTLVGRLKNKDYALSATDFEDSRQIISRLINNGKEAEALNLLEDISRAGSKAGQAVQALSLWNKLTPEGAVLHAQRIVDRFNQQYPKQAVKLSELQIGKIANLQKEVMRQIPGTREYDKAVALALKAQEEVLPKSLGKKIAAYRNISMLLNAKTSLRNITGNMVFNGVEKGLVEPLAAGLDKLISLKSGLRTRVMPQWKTYGKGLAEGTKNGIEDVSLGINTRQLGGKYDLQPGEVFSGKFGRGAEKLLNYSLQVPDRAFYEATLKESMANQMKAAKVTKPTSEMLKIAEEEALESVFQNDSTLAKAVLGLRRGLNRMSHAPLKHLGVNLREGTLGAGNIVMPFAQVPANLTQQSINYSPLGVVKGIGNLRNGLQRQATKDLARSLIGSAGMLGSAELAKKGFITGDMNQLDLSYANNLERKNNLAIQGKRPFQVNGVAYNMFSPLSTVMAAGAKMGQGGKPKDVALATVETIGDMPFLSGLSRLIRTGNQQGWDSAVTNTIADIPSQFVPTLMSQIADVVNPTVKETYDPNMYKQGLNKAVNKLPGLRNLLPDKVSVTGEKIRKYDSEGGALVWDAMVNPTFVNQEKAHPVISELDRLYQTTGEAGQYLPVVKRNISYTDSSGQRQNRKLSAEEYSDYQRYVGQANVFFLDQLFQNSGYWRASPEEQLKQVQQVEQDVNELAKKMLFNIGEKIRKNPVKQKIDTLRRRSSKLRRGLRQQQIGQFMQTID